MRHIVIANQKKLEFDIYVYIIYMNIYNVYYM